MSHLKQGQSSLDSIMSHLKQGQSSLDSIMSHLKQGQSSLDSIISHLKQGQSSLDSIMTHLKQGQSSHWYENNNIKFKNCQINLNCLEIQLLQQSQTDAGIAVITRWSKDVCLLRVMVYYPTFLKYPLCGSIFFIISYVCKIYIYSYYFIS